MKKYHVPIFVSEYFVDVFVGTREELIKEGAKACDETQETFTYLFNNKRGMACNLLAKKNPKHPLIVLDGSLPAHIALSTLAHEALHAMDYISDYLGMEDRSGEFKAHGIGEIMRHTTELMLKKN